MKKSLESNYDKGLKKKEIRARRERGKRWDRVVTENIETRSILCGGKGQRNNLQLVRRLKSS